MLHLYSKRANLHLLTMRPRKVFVGDSPWVELTHISFTNRDTIALGSCRLVAMSSGCNSIASRTHFRYRYMISFVWSVDEDLGGTMIYILKKRYDFWILTCLLIPVFFCILKESNYEIWQGVFKLTGNLLIKNGQLDFWYNLSIGYIISYIFYIMVNFIPEVYKEKKKTEESLPIRCARHREIQLLIFDMTSIWDEMFKIGEDKKIIELSNANDMKDIYSFDNFEKVLPYINCTDIALILQHKISWIEKLITQVERFKETADTFLSKYNHSVDSSSVFQYVAYLKDKSFIVGLLPMLLKVSMYAYNSNVTLDKAINTSDKSVEKNIKLTFEYMNSLCEWYNSEYEQLLKRYEPAKDIIVKYDFIKQYRT